LEKTVSLNCAESIDKYQTVIFVETFLTVAGTSITSSGVVIWEKVFFPIVSAGAIELESCNSHLPLKTLVIEHPPNPLS
jgi:hypothetical protein